MYIDALTYPIRRSGWIMILVGAIFSVILDVLQFAPFVGVIAAVFSAGYFGAFYLDIIGTTMGGKNELPEWPNFSSFMDDILRPFFRLVGLGILSFAPTAAVAMLMDEKAASFLPTMAAAVAFGCCYFPMAVLATQAFGSFGAALPHVVLPAVIKALPGYLLALGALVLVLVVCTFAQNFVGSVPYVGWFLTSAVALYGLMFQARLIGLIYVSKQEKLGWE